MALNDQKICIQIAKKPGSRAVDLADVFDCELTDISAALRSLVDVGDLVRTSGTGPNGQPAQFYSLSDTFAKSKEGKLVLAQSAALNTAVPAALPAPAPALASSAPPSPAPAAVSPADDSSLGRIERAIAHIKEHGPTSDADMRKVLNLRNDQYATSFIGRAVKDGRLAKDGRDWTLGSGSAPAAIPRRPAFGGPLGLPGATPNPTPSSAPAPASVAASRPAGASTSQASPVLQSVAVKAAVDDAVAATEVADGPIRFRCGSWSDGVLELRRDGAMIAELTPAEQAVIARHFHQQQAQKAPQ
jgi:hypothetical protein